MCGLAGYIGESKKPVLTYQLITKLFEKSDSRGIDAAGYWGTETGISGNVLYHKEPGKSSLFVKKDVWKVIFKHNPNLLLVHARGASKGVGEPSINQNNHPFTNSDKSIGLIHNGRVDDCEYNAFKQKYELQTQCDSEMLLRIFEGGESYTSKELKESFGEAEGSHRLAGIKDIFSLINEGHMAVAIGERSLDGSRLLWLFRNKHRPLWVVDMREALGQVFFVSEPTIWEDAVRECSGIKSIARTQKLIELPIEEVWNFQINSDHPCPKNVKRYEVHRESISPWQFDGKKINSLPKNAQFQVITRLDENDNVLEQGQNPRKPLPQVVEYEELKFKDVEKKCNDIVNVVNNIRIQTEQLINERSIIKHDFDQLIQHLEQQRQELEELSLIISQ